MEITLEQLKEIAKAAYGCDLPEVDGHFEYLDWRLSNKRRECFYLMFESEKYPTESISILSIIYCDGRIHIGAGSNSCLYNKLILGREIDHLLAIKKMRDLGLIKID